MQTQAEVRETRVDPSAWESVIATPGTPQVIVGGPGTGKTEFLCRRIVHLTRSDNRRHTDSDRHGTQGGGCVDFTRRHNRG
jgi:hypothetical protein